MRKTAIGLVMLTDERPFAHAQTDELNTEVINTWADIIRNNSGNVDGSQYEVVVGKHIVHDVETGREVGIQLSRADCRQIIFLYNVWNFPFLVWPVLNQLGKEVPILSLSNNAGKFPGNVGLLATDGAIRQTGRRTHRIVGDHTDEATIAKVVDWIRASQAYTTIRGEVFGCYGGHSMGMETGFPHMTAMLTSFGVTPRQIDQLWLVNKMDSMDVDEVRKAREWLESLMGDRLRYDGDALTPEKLETQIRLYLSMVDTNREKGFTFCGLKAQRELTEHVCIGDVAEMMMNDPYDWNGPKESIVCATEADTFAALTMQLLKYISGGLPTLFMDIRLYHPEKDIWDFCNSGNHSSYFAARSLDAMENFKTITFHPALKMYFPAGGASVEFDASPGKLTFARLGLWDQKPFMVIVPGEVLDLPEAERQAINNETDPTWPHVHARMDCNFDEFLKVFPANHIQAVEGDVVDALVMLCEIAGIPPVVLGPRGKDTTPPIWERVK